MNNNTLGYGLLLVIAGLLLVGSFVPPSFSQPLRGSVASSNFAIHKTATGQQFYVNQQGLNVYLPGAGVSANVVQVYTGPLGNQWYMDLNGARVNIPPSATQAPAQSAGQSTDASNQAGGFAPTFAPTIAVPAGVPLYTNPYGYQYYLNPAGQPVYINGTANGTANVNRSTTINNTVNSTSTGSNATPTEPISDVDGSTKQAGASRRDGGRFGGGAGKEHLNAGSSFGLGSGGGKLFGRGQNDGSNPVRSPEASSSFPSLGGAVAGDRSPLGQQTSRTQAGHGFHGHAPSGGFGGGGVKQNANLGSLGASMGGRSGGLNKPKGSFSKPAGGFGGHGGGHHGGGHRH